MKKKAPAKEKLSKEKPSKEEILTLLNEIPDPELQIGIVDLGLIYDIIPKGDILTIKMTLTTMGCPIGPMISEQIDKKLKGKGYKTILTDLVWDPPWNIEKMKPEIRQMMFGN